MSIIAGTVSIRRALARTGLFTVVFAITPERNLFASLILPHSSRDLYLFSTMDSTSVTSFVSSFAVNGSTFTSSEPSFAPAATTA